MPIDAIPYEPDPVSPPDVDPWLLDSPTVPPDVRRKPYQLDPASGLAVPRGLAAGGELAERVSELPGHLYRPRGAYPLDLPLNRIPVVVGIGLTVIFSTWPRVPQGKLGVVHRLAFAVTAGALSDAQLTTLKNSAPVAPYTGVVGTIGTLEAPQECFIELDAGDIFSVAVANIGFAPVTVAVRTIGWFYGRGFAK